MILDSRRLRLVGYQNPTFPDLDIEHASLADLYGRAPRADFLHPHRLTFHHLMLITAGHGSHEIDFQRFLCDPGTVIHVRPGQVHRFGLEPGLRAEIILFRPIAIEPDKPDTQFGRGGTLVEEAVPDGGLTLDPAARNAIHRSFRDVAREYAVTDGSEISARILAHQLRILLLRLARASLVSTAGAVQTRHLLTYRRFLRELETHFARVRQVQYYADRLNCSIRTLSRACVAVGGLPPKSLIARRVALEAKRLLVHTALPVSAVATELGFGEATNFVKFFRDSENLTPAAFRKFFTPSFKG